MFELLLLAIIYNYYYYQIRINSCHDCLELGTAILLPVLVVVVKTRQE